MFLPLSLKLEFGFLSSVTPIMEGIVDLHNHILFFLILVFVFVFWIFGNVLYNFWWRIHHPRREEDLQHRASLAPLRHLSHSTFLEIVWTIIPSLILIAIAVPSFALLYAMDEIMEPTLTLKVIGHQWYWSYQYSNSIAQLTYTPLENPELTPATLWEALRSARRDWLHDFLRDFPTLPPSGEEFTSADELYDRLSALHGGSADPFQRALLDYFNGGFHWNRDSLSTALLHSRLVAVYPTAFFAPPQPLDIETVWTEFPPLLVELDGEFSFPSQSQIHLDSKAPVLASLTASPHSLLFPSGPLFRSFFHSDSPSPQSFWDLRWFMELWAHRFLAAKTVEALSTPVTLKGSGDTLPGVQFDSYMLDEADLPLGGYRLLEVDEPVVLPANTHIRLLITAEDVIHSFAVPQLGIKVDAVPGRLNQQGIFIKRRGTFYGQCSELCGVNHGFMPIVIKAVSMKEFVHWYLHKFNQLYPEQGLALVSNPSEVTAFLKGETDIPLPSIPSGLEGELFPLLCGSDRLLLHYPISVPVNWSLFQLEESGNLFAPLPSPTLLPPYDWFSPEFYASIDLTDLPALATRHSPLNPHPLAIEVAAHQSPALPRGPIPLPPGWWESFLEEVDGEEE